jgi:CheY-like chemotaxis protein
MPHRSGFEVLDELKSDDAARNIPIVIHTSKNLSRSDYERLAGRHAAILPKAGKRRVEALRSIRQILDDPSLFKDEPEFASPESETI